MESESKDMSIFKVICGAVTDTEFTSAQQEFYEKNAHIFNDDDENKLSYTDVFESYVYLLDQTITAKLLEAKYDEQADLEPFYKGFKANIKLYEAENPDVVDTLYTFIDFQKFKDNILEIKKSIDYKGTGNEGSDKKGFLVLSFDDFYKLRGEDINDPALKWKQSLDFKKKNGVECKIYMRPMENSKLSLAQSRLTIYDVTCQ